MVSNDPELPIEAYRGAARAWQCDEMGHLNAAFYIKLADEGLTTILAELSIPYRERDRLLRPASHHIRFLREIRAGTSLTMRGGVIGIDDRGLSVVEELIDSETGECCMVVKTDLGWSPEGKEICLDRAQAASAALLTKCDPTFYARGIADSPPPTIDLALARSTPLTSAALGCWLIEEGQADSPFVAVAAIISRIADSTRLLSRKFERTAREADIDKPNLGTAALECRLDYFQWPRVGDRFIVLSGFSEIGTGSSRRVVQWMFDADSGLPIAVSNSLEVNFDKTARRARPIAATVRDTLAEHLVTGFLPQWANHSRARRRSNSPERRL